jgi:uncharacterized protein (DUF697 family)/predicted GTPase
MFKKILDLFSTKHRDAELDKHLEEVRKKTPVPVFWLYGKTQSGKTSMIKFLTGADDAEIGQGFKPTTRHSRHYLFPAAEAPLVSFLDTRGVDEPDYDPQEDLARFDALAHVIVITVKVLDHALENLINHFRPIRQSRRERPVLLVLTCLHEAYPQQQHPQPYPFVAGKSLDEAAGAVPEPLLASLKEQARRFEGLYDYLVPVDLTKAGEGFDEPNYGGARLKEVLLDALPAVYRSTLITLDEATRELQDIYARHALPHILGYSSMAATAGALPIPWLDLLILPGIQTRMIYHLAQFYGQPLTGERFLELASTLGLGMMMRQAVREVAKFIPFVGSAVGAAVAGAATFALGKAFCYYYSAVLKGHVPKPEDIRRYYQEQLALAERMWKEKKVSG